MAMDAAELGRWMRFAAKGGIGRCVAIRDCEAQEIGDLMFLEGDEIIVLHQVPSSSTTSTTDSPSGDRGDGQFLGYCEEIVGRFNARDVRFTTKLKKAVMTKRASSSSSPAPSAPTASATAPISTSTSTSSTVTSISTSTSTGSTSRSPSATALSPSPSMSSTVYTSAGLTSSPRASPAPSTFSTTSSSTLGIHEPMVRSTSATSGSVLKSSFGSAVGISGGGDSLERRSSAATSSMGVTRTASPLQQSYTSPSLSAPPSTFGTASASNSLSNSSLLVSSPANSSFVSFSPTPSSVSPSPRETTFPPSISSSASPIPSSSAPSATRSISYSASSSARNTPSPALHHSRSLGGPTSSSTPSSPTPTSVPLSGATSPSPRMAAQPLQPHSQQQHRYTAHAPSPLSFATASALSQRVSSTSSPSFSRASAASSYSYSWSSSAGTPTSPAFSATGTLSPTSPSFSSSSISMGHDGLTPTNASMGGGSLTPTTNPLRITKRSPSLGHGSVHGGMGIPGLRSPPPVSPLPELPAGAGSRRGSDTEPPASTSSTEALSSTAGSTSTPSISTSPSNSPPTSTTSMPPSHITASSSYPGIPHASIPVPPSLNLPAISDTTPPSPSSAGAPTTGITTSSDSPMNSAYAARLAFTPLPSSVGGFGAIAGHVEEHPVPSPIVGEPAREEVVNTIDQDRLTGASRADRAEVNMRDEKTAELSTTAAAIPSSTANDIGLSLLQLQDLADGMYSYGSDSDSDSDSQYSRNSYAPSPRSGAGLESGPTSRAASRSDGKIVDGVGVVDRNGRRKSLAPSTGTGGGRRATLTASTFSGADVDGSSRSRSPLQMGEKAVEDDGGSEDGTVEGVAYDLNEPRKEEGGGGEEAGDDDAKALLAKMEEMNAMVAAMPAFPTKPSPGVVARSAVVAPSSSGGSASYAGSGSAAGAARSGAHLSPTSPTFPQDASERERRPSLVSAYSAHSIRSARSGASGATSGSGEDYDIYDSYRYSRYSVLSGRSGSSQAPTISSLPRAGGKRMDSMGSVEEGHEDGDGTEHGTRARGLDMVLDELSFGDESVRGSGVGAGPSHERTISIDSEASVYTQDSSEQAMEADTTILGASTEGNNSGVSTATGIHATGSTNRPAPLDLSKQSNAQSKSVTSPLLHTSWGSATSSAKSSAAPFDLNNASFGLQAQSLVGALSTERAGEVKSARAEVEERVASPGLAHEIRQRIQDQNETEDGDRTVSTIVDDTGLGQRIVIEDDEELPSRIEDDGLGMDDTMTSMNTRRSSGSPEPEANINILRGLAPTLIVSNRTPSPVDVDVGGDDTAAPVPAAVPRPPRSAGLSPFAASNQRRSIFLPHPGAPKAPSQVDDSANSPTSSASDEPLASSLHPNGGQQVSAMYQHPVTNNSPVPIPRPNIFQMIQISLSTPPRPPPPILPGMRLPPAPLMKGPTIYGRTDVDLCASVGPVPISWSIDPFPLPQKPNSGSPSGNSRSKGGSGVTGQAQSPPAAGTGRAYPTRSMSMGANQAANALPATSSPLAKPASGPLPGATTQPPASSSTITPPSLSPSPLLNAPVTVSVSGGASGALPRANFVPRAPGLRPRSRSFSGFNSTSDSSDKKVSHEAPPLSVRTSDTSPVLRMSSVSSTTTLTSSIPALSSSPSPSLMSSSSLTSSPTSSVSTPISKPPIPSAPKPIPKPPSGLTSKKPSSLSLRSSPLSSSLSVGGGLKSPKMPSSPLAMSVVVAQRDSVVSVSDVHEGDGGDVDKKNGPDPGQLRLRAMGSMPNLGSASTSSFSSTRSPPPKAPSPLNMDSAMSTIRPAAVGARTKDDLIDAEVRNMSPTMREPRSPPPFAGLPLLVPPPSQQQQSHKPSFPPRSEAQPPTSPPAQQPTFFPSQGQGVDGGQPQPKPQRQPSLRSKLSLPNLRRKQSRQGDDEPDRERDFRGQTQPQRDRDIQQETDLQRRDNRERDDTLDIERERELLQVRDLEFELVRPSLPAAQREWGAARTSEDSGVLGRETVSFDYPSPNGGPFRGADGASRGSFESRGSLDMQMNGAGRGDRTEGSRLRPTSPAFSIASGAPSSKSLPTQSGNSESPTNSGMAGNTAAEIEAHRAREQRWLSLLASAPSAAGTAAYTLPTSSNTPSSGPSPSSSAAYTPNSLAKSRKTRKLLLESAVPSSVRFRVWVFLTDARSRAVPGVYDALVARGAGRVKGGVVNDIRQDIREEYEKLAARATSPSLASRASISQIDDGVEDATLAAVKPFTPSHTGGDAPITTLLLAYLNMVPDITYSRGLIHVLGHLLLLSPDEDAFWIFVSVMDSWLRGYFVVLPGNGVVPSVTPGAITPVAPQLDVDALLFMRALEANEPQVAKRLLVDVGLPSVSICGPWFSSVFVGVLPVGHLNRVWDLFLFEGIPLLIRVGIALITCLKRHLLAPLPLASSISASSSPLSSPASSHSPHGTVLLSLLQTPPSTIFPPSPDAFISMALAVKLKDDEVRKQRVKMEQQVSLKLRQQASSSSNLAPPGHRPGSLRGSFQALRAGGSVISLPRAAS